MCLNYAAQRWTVGSQVFPLLAAKFDWETDKSTEQHTTMLTALAILGTVLGAGYGTMHMQRGRRKAMIVAGFISLIGSALL